MCDVTRGGVVTGGVMTSEVEIGVWVEGVQKWVTGVTRRTTCHDLIKALLRAQHSGRTDDSDVIQYVIVERWRKVERPLDHEQRILKVSPRQPFGTCGPY